MPRPNSNDLIRAAMIKQAIIEEIGPSDGPYRSDETINARGLDKKTAKLTRIMKKFGDKGMSPEAQAANLLANLMHFCEQMQEDFERAIRVSADHFAMESGGADVGAAEASNQIEVKWAEVDDLGAMLKKQFGGPPKPWEDRLTDIVSDLRHACANLEMDFSAALSTAQAAYEDQAPRNRPGL
jgi:hypothetical protein